MTSRNIVRQTGSLDVAERLINSITRRFYLLASHPRIGRARDDLLAGVRSFPVGNYVVVYDIDGEDVRILRVAHGRRDLAALFDR